MDVSVNHDKILVKKIGEDLVVAKFFSEGYVVIKRNYMSPHGKIDLICERDSIIYFINTSVTDSINGTITSNNLNHEDVRRVAKDYMMENYHESKRPYDFKAINIQISETKCI